MKQPLKMHRPGSAIAAVLVILSGVLNIAASFPDSSAYVAPFFWIRLLGNALIAVMLSVILFRGRKDAFTGIVFLLSAIASLFSVFYNLLSICLTMRMQEYMLMNMIEYLLVAAFRAVAAVECLGAGRISTGNGRIFLWLLPLLGFGCALTEQMILSINSGMLIGEAVFGSMVYLIPQWLGPVLMGVALAVPAHKKSK